VLAFEKNLTSTVPQDKKYGYEIRLNRSTRVYSAKFSSTYHQALDRQVEKRLRASIKSVGDFWYSCWVDAGQPDLANKVYSEVEFDLDYLKVADSLWRDHRLIRSRE
jgi:hypothetical protein